MKSKIIQFFKDIGLPQTLIEKEYSTLKQAFIHRSSVHESSKTEDNERLEFLGDAVLELVTTEFLFKHYDHPEGELTNYRSALVKRENLAKVARKLKLGPLLSLSRGEDISGGREKDYILANTLEAIIGVLHLVIGIKKTTDFIKKHILVELKAILKSGSHIDSKSRLQEISQGELGITPVYKVTSEKGKDHDKEFDMTVLLKDKAIGAGTGKSKKEAQISAADDALKKEKKWKTLFPPKS